MESGYLLGMGQLLMSLIGGGIAGAAVTYYLQNRGQIRLHASRWEASYSRDDEAKPVEFEFHIVVYNESAMPGGVWDCRVVFSKAGEDLFVSHLHELDMDRMVEIIENASLPYSPPLEVIELPPRTPVHLWVAGTIEDADKDKVRQSDKAWFVATMSPSRKERKWEINTDSPKPFPTTESRK